MTISITNCVIYPVKNPTGKILAYASIELGGCFQLTGLRVIQGAQNLFVGYPVDSAHEGVDYRQIFYPITAEMRTTVEQAILTAYKSQL